MTTQTTCLSPPTEALPVVRAVEDSDEPSVLLIRSGQFRPGGRGGTPHLHFWERGAAGMWTATMETLIKRYNRPQLTPQTLLAIGPHLREAMVEAFDLLQHRAGHQVCPV